MTRGEAFFDLVRRDLEPSPIESSGLCGVRVQLGGPIAPDGSPCNLAQVWPPGMPFLRRVLVVLQAGSWVTLRGLAARVGCSETGVSARLRDLRKAKYGRHSVEVRAVKFGPNGRRRRFYRLGKGGA